MNQNQIMRYVMGKDGRKIGMLVGEKVESAGHGEPIQIGWSRCKAGDKFNRDEGYAMAAKNMGSPLPPSFMVEARRFRVQCFLYFNSAVQHVEEMYCVPNKPAKRDFGVVRNSGHYASCTYPKTACSCKELSNQKR